MKEVNDSEQTRDFVLFGIQKLLIKSPAKMSSEEFAMFIMEFGTRCVQQGVLTGILMEKAE